MFRGLLTALVSTLALAAPAQADMLRLSGVLSPTVGVTTTYFLQFSADSARTIESFDLALAFDKSLVEIGNVRLAASTASAFSSTVNLSPAEGLIASASANSLGISVTAGSVTDLLAFDLKLLASTAGTDLNILRNLSTTLTSVNESLALNPAPTNGFDPGVDLRLGTAVPEPGSAALLLLGGVGIAVRRRRRRSRRDRSNRAIDA